MSISSMISILLILSGSAIMLFSVILSLKIKRLVSRELSVKWHIAVILMAFLFLGYITSVLVLIFNIRLPLELLTGGVFFGGACFVLIVMNLVKITILEQIDEIVKRKKTDKALKESENNLLSVFNNIQDVIYRTDREGNIIWVSPSAVNLLGCESVDDILGKNVTDFYLLPNEKKSFLEKLSVSGSVSDVDVSLGRYDGIKIIVSTSARYYKDDKGDIAGVEGICRDISSRKKAEDVLHLLSLTDELTGLYNRRGFFALAEHHLKKIKRKGTKNFLFYADLDNLKGINDSCGHLEGDMAIKAFAEILKSTFRESDVIARIGGDEFVIFPVPLTETEEGSIVRRLQDTLDSHNLNGEHEYRLSFSYGIAHCNPEMNCNIDELLASADELMYSHKNQKYD